MEIFKGFQSLSLPRYKATLYVEVKRDVYDVMSIADDISPGVCAGTVCRQEAGDIWSFYSRYSRWYVNICSAAITEVGTSHLDCRAAKCLCGEVFYVVNIGTYEEDCKPAHARTQTQELPMLLRHKDTGPHTMGTIIIQSDFSSRRGLRGGPRGGLPIIRPQKLHAIKTSLWFMKMLTTLSINTRQQIHFSQFNNQWVIPADPSTRHYTHSPLKFHQLGKSPFSRAADWMLSPIALSSK